MNSKQITAVALKIIGIWILINIALDLPAFGVLLKSAQQYSGETDSQLNYALLAVSFIVVGIIVALVLFKVSNSVLHSVDSESPTETVSPKFIMQIAGLYFSVTALSDLPIIFIALANSTENLNHSYGYLAAVTIKLLVGLFLIGKPTAWVNWFRWLGSK